MDPKPKDNQPQDPNAAPSQEVTPVADPKPAEPKPGETPAVVPPAEPKPAEPTIKDALPQDPPAPAPSKDSVPLATFLEVKAEAKEVPGLKAEIERLQKLVTDGKVATPVEISDSVAAIGAEYGVDAGFLAKLTSAIEAKVKGASAADVEAALKPYKDKEREEKFEAAFSTHYDAALATMPEYKEVVNREVIKQLSLLPQNANKTFAALIEETYGHVVSGKRSIETTVPGGGKDTDPIDYARAAREPEYLNAILADPVRKAEYNKDLHKRLRI